MRRTFEEWIKEVEKEVETKHLLSIGDLPDFDFRLAYENNKTPKATASAVIRNAKSYF